MTDSINRPGLHVPARELPIPNSISAQAQAQMAIRRPPMPPYPALDDLAGWRHYAATINQFMLPVLQQWGADVAADVETLNIEGIPVYAVTPHSVSPDDNAVFLDLHGGAFIVGGGECCRAEAILLAGAIGMRVWSVDYRSPPDFPYPAPLDDCVTVYRHLLKQLRPQEIAVGGASAGANLAAALVLRARDEGLPMPAAAVLNTPGIDMTNSGDSVEVNKGIDSALPADMDSIGQIYAGGHDFTHPYISPLFGNFKKGFCPSLLIAGTRDLFLSNAARMHASLRAVDIHSELYIIEAASHGGFHGAPEEAAMNREIRHFIRSRRAAAR